jgi:hypothetical protein
MSSLEMTADDFKILEESLCPFQSLLDDFALPSLRTLIRHIDAWRTSLASHFPVIHFPTFQVRHCIPELILAMAALGALQTLEENMSKKLYGAARYIALHRLKMNNMDLGVCVRVLCVIECLVGVLTFINSLRLYQVRILLTEV